MAVSSRPLRRPTRTCWCWIIYKFTDQAAPEVQFKAEEYINLGYQRLATFEVGGSGGFSLFGDPPPDRMLTAYGLQEFSDMSRVYDIDPALVERAAAWLFGSKTATDRGPTTGGWCTRTPGPTWETTGCR